MSTVSPLAQRFGVGAAAFLVASVAAWEGRKLVAYSDIGGVPTVCDGITGADVVLGKTYTMAECDVLLAKHLERHASGALACVRVPMSLSEQVAWVHFAYNVGVAAFCSSSAVRKLNAGDHAGACAEISRWTFVAGMDCRLASSQCAGIPARRAHERALCEGRIAIPGLFGGVVAGVST